MLVVPVQIPPLPFCVFCLAFFSFFQIFLPFFSFFLQFPLFPFLFFSLGFKFRLGLGLGLGLDLAHKVHMNEVPSETCKPDCQPFLPTQLKSYNTIQYNTIQYNTIQYFINPFPLGFSGLIYIRLKIELNISNKIITICY